MIHLFVTAALNVPNLTKELLIERNTEYRFSLNRLLSYSLPIHCVISECSDQEYDSSIFKIFPFHTRVCIPSTALWIGKSQKESFSIQYLLRHIQHQFNDNDWIVKVSGRYLLINDEFINMVKQANETTDLIYKRCDEKQAFTFCFALRWKWFKLFYSEYVNKIGMKNVEQHIVDFAAEYALTIHHASMLGIYTNINNDNKYVVY